MGNVPSAAYVTGLHSGRRPNDINLAPAQAEGLINISLGHAPSVRSIHVPWQANGLPHTFEKSASNPVHSLCSLLQ